MNQGAVWDKEEETEEDQVDLERSSAPGTLSWELETHQLPKRLPSTPPKPEVSQQGRAGGLGTPTTVY